MAAPESAVPSVSVVVPCRNEQRFIAACLDSVLASTYPLDRLEVLVVDGMSEDGTREIIRRYVARHPTVRLLDNPRRIVPTALNTGIGAASGDVIVRMDAHATYPPDYLTRLVTALRETGADNVGGVIVTRPADDGPMARAIALGLSHPVGVGNAYFRIGTTERRWVDTVPFGCYRRAVFERIGMFDEELVGGEDDEFNYRLLKHGGRILLLPTVTCNYYARGSLQQVARMFYQYGHAKPLVGRKVGQIMTVRQLIPALFIVSVVTSAVLSFWVPAAVRLLAALAGTYGAVVLGAATRAIRPHGIRCALALAAVFPVVHLSYGLGFLTGLGALWRSAAPPSRRSSALPLAR